MQSLVYLEHICFVTRQDAAINVAQNAAEIAAQNAAENGLYIVDELEYEEREVVIVNAAGNVVAG